MKKITIGEKDDTKKYDFRETCFGLYVKNNKILVTIDPKRKQYTLVGGGIEDNESHEDTFKREFLEEVGIKIKDIKEFITIDCFWLAGGDYPMESLAHFYTIDIDEYLSILDLLIDADYLLALEEKGMYYQYFDETHDNGDYGEKYFDKYLEKQPRSINVICDKALSRFNKNKICSSVVLFYKR